VPSLRTEDRRGGGGIADRSRLLLSRLTRSRAVSFVRLAWRKFQEDEASVRAMGLTYTTILSLVPFLAVAFSVLKGFGVQNQLEPTLARVFAPLGAEAVVVSRRIVEFVSNMQVGVLGALGVAGLFYTVISLVGTIESSLNRIWRVRESRSWPEMFRDYLSVVMVGPVLVFTALALTASAQSYTVVREALALVPPFVMVVATQLLPYVLLSLAFTLLYRFMPNTRVSLRAAAAGGVFAGVGWKLAGTAFTAFVAESGRYAAIYSSFAILILFLIWIYVSWSIALAGAEIASLVDHFDEELRLASGERFAGRERDALRLLAVLAERHDAGAPPIERAELSRLLARPAASIEEIVSRLVDARLVLVAADPPGVALARPPERVPVAEALAALEPISATTPPAAHGPIDQVLLRRREAAMRAIADATLKELLDEPAEAAVPTRQAS
jgi:membrane protein